MKRGKRAPAGGGDGGGGGGAAPLRLPESGLAGEILASLASGAPAAAPAGDVPRLPPTAARGPERLLAFADLLEREGAGAGEAEREEPETWVTFALAGEVFGLPVTHVKEILRVGTITRVPRAPRPVRGITNLRGRVLVIVDTRARIGLPRAETDDKSRILVVQSRGRQIGLLVDSVLQVVRLLPSCVEPPPAEVMTAASAYVVGVYQLAPGLVILLDADRLLLLDSAAGEAPRTAMAAATAAPPAADAADERGGR